MDRLPVSVERLVADLDGDVREFQLSLGSDIIHEKSERPRLDDRKIISCK